MQGVVSETVGKKNTNPPVEAPKHLSGRKKIAVRPDLNPRWKNRDRAGARSKFLSTGAAGVKYEEEEETNQKSAAAKRRDSLARRGSISGGWVGGNTGKQKMVDNVLGTWRRTTTVTAPFKPVHCFDCRGCCYKLKAKCGIELPTLLRAILEGSYRAVEVNLNRMHKADLGAYDPEGRSYVTLAVMEDRDDILHLLIKSEAPVDKPDVKTGMTPLHHAIIQGSVTMMYTLLKAGADIDSSDHLGVTPLMLACQQGVENLAVDLVDSFADLAATDVNGWTPLHFAVKGNQLNIVEGLLMNGADRNAKDSLGNTPEMWARVLEHGDVEALLSEWGGKEAGLF